MRFNIVVIVVEDFDDFDDSKMKFRLGMNRNCWMCLCLNILFKYVVVNMKIYVFKKGKFYK